MNRKQAEADEAARIITDDEAKVALQKAGYSLELDIYRMFRAGGMNATIGPWARIATGGPEGPVHAELDLVASEDRSVETGARVRIARSGLTVFVEAKRLPAPSRFVGLLGELPGWSEELGEANLRSHLAGVPALGSGVLPLADPGSEFFALTKLIDSAVPLNGAPLCVHWAIVRRNGKTRPFAEGDKEFFKDMSQLVAARVVYSRNLSQRVLASKSGPPLVRQLQVVLVVDTASLYTYDAEKDMLSEVDRLSIFKGFPVDGEPVAALVDVVTPSALPTLISKYRESAKLLQSGLAGAAEVLPEQLKALRDRYAMWLLESAPRFT